MCTLCMLITPTTFYKFIVCVYSLNKVKSLKNIFPLAVAFKS